MFAIDQSSGTFQIDESGYGRSQDVFSTVEVAGAVEVGEGNVGVSRSSSPPGGVGFDRYRKMTKTMTAIIAINQVRNLVLLISFSVTYHYCTTYPVDAIGAWSFNESEIT
jgi:hypothetical protein